MKGFVLGVLALGDLFLCVATWAHVRIEQARLNAEESDKQRKFSREEFDRRLQLEREELARRERVQKGVN